MLTYVFLLRRFMSRITEVKFDIHTANSIFFLLLLLLLLHIYFWCYLCEKTSQIKQLKEFSIGTYIYERDTNIFAFKS